MISRTVRLARSRRSFRNSLVAGPNDGFRDPVGPAQPQRLPARATASGAKAVPVPRPNQRSGTGAAPLDRRYGARGGADVPPPLFLPNGWARKELWDVCPVLSL